jgi:hypothetical protein
MQTLLLFLHGSYLKSYMDNVRFYKIIDEVLFNIFEMQGINSLKTVKMLYSYNYIFFYIAA